MHLQLMPAARCVISRGEVGREFILEARAGGSDGKEVGAVRLQDQAEPSRQGHGARCRGHVVVDAAKKIAGLVVEKQEHSGSVLNMNLNIEATPAEIQAFVGALQQEGPPGSYSKKGPPERLLLAGAIRFLAGPRRGSGDASAA
jgi:hypothetical protein